MFGRELNFQYHAHRKCQENDVDENVNGPYGNPKRVVGEAVFLQVEAHPDISDGMAEKSSGHGGGKPESQNKYTKKKGL